MLVSNPPPPFSFFSQPKALSSARPSVAPVVVKARSVTVHRAVTAKAPEPLPQTAAASTDESRPRQLLKRKHADEYDAHRAKRSRSSSLDATPPPPTRAGSRQRGSDSAFSSSASSSRASTRTRTTPPAPDALYRSSRSRSASVLPATDDPVPRDCYLAAYSKEEEDGFRSSEMVVRPLMASYKAHFVNSKDPTDLSFQPHLTRYPVAELEFPNSGATERYILLSPKDPDHYDPIKDLFRTLYVILDTYLTREQRAVFGTLPDDPAAPDGSTNHLATLRRAYMQKNGPLFQSTMLQINALIRTFKYPPLPDDLFSPPPENAFKAAVRGWNPTGLPRALALRIMEETYQRVVGPHTNELKRYTAFSSQTYGELTPALVAKLIAQTRLGPGSLFLDLGSGVGNVAIQAALQAGSSAFGVEMMPGPADLAREQRRQMAIRTRMWGINMGDVELEQGDMLNSARVTELMGKADVVLVNNKVFKESLNEAIRPKFLDLKEGAIVVSLQPFVASLNARLTERNLDDLSAIFDVSEHTYQPMDVSWSAVAGSYYVHRVDREGYAAIRAQFERGQQRAGSARGTRARR